MDLANHPPSRGPPSRYRRGMSSTPVHSSLTVQAPPAAVFAILADPRQHPRIDGSGTVQGTVSGPERLTLGSEFGMWEERTMI